MAVQEKNSMTTMAEDRESRSLARATYVLTLLSVATWALPFGTAVLGFITLPFAKITGGAWLFLGGPLCGLWIATALPFWLREMGKPGWAILASFTSLVSGVLAVLILQ
jgi:hypothetical protein